ncbi:MAG TPA: hypothetical protein VD908_07970 [Cytophagales bacterium]|nr:hypothetical protein [Cytophagales bacterium]
MDEGRGRERAEVFSSEIWKKSGTLITFTFLSNNKTQAIKIYPFLLPKDWSESGERVEEVWRNSETKPKIY